MKQKAELKRLEKIQLYNILNREWIFSTILETYEDKRDKKAVESALDRLLDVLKDNGI